MKLNLLKLTLFAFCIACCYSCKDNKESVTKDDTDILMKTQPEFDSESQVIYYKEQLKYDIKGDLVIPFDFDNLEKVEIACELSFYNYGEDIRLFNGCVDDCFINGLGDRNFRSLILGKEHTIKVESIRHSKKYGDWALASIDAGYTILNNVFVTPLAMKAYKNRDDDSYIFIQFVSNEQYMNVLFYGDSQVWELMKKRRDLIHQRDYGRWSIDNIPNPGQFWHQLPISERGY